MLGSFRARGSSESTVGRSKSDLVLGRDRSNSEAYLNRKESASSELASDVDFGAIANYFLGFWRARQAINALNTLERYESKRLLKNMRQKYGQWCPPPEVVQALKKPPQPRRSRLPDTKDCRNLRFVLKMLGCSFHENRPFKQFLKAKSVRQKRWWIHKYMTPDQEDDHFKMHYSEPICEMRLKRLYHFFPNRFKEQGDCMLFNDRLITYDKDRNVFYIGILPEDDGDSL